MGNKIINLFTDGTVKTKDREFTKIVGGFGDGKPVLVAKYIADLMGYELKRVNETINNNIESFEQGVHIINLKNSVDINDPVYETLKTLGYSKQSISNSKNIYILSEAGFLLYLKFAEGDKAVELYKDFIEEYFKTKAEVKVLKVTLQEEIDKLNNDLAFLIGLGIIEKDMSKRRDLRLKEEEINQRIRELENRLIEELTAEKYKVFEEKYKTFMDNEGCFTFEDTAKILSTRAEEDKVNVKLNRVTLPKLLREKEILSKEKKGDTFKNLPRSGYEKYFNTNPQDISIINGKGENIIISKTQTRVNKLGLDFIYDLLVQKVS